MNGDLPTVLEPDDTTSVVLAMEEYSETDVFRHHALDWAEGACPSAKARAAVDILLDEYSSSVVCADRVQQHLDGNDQW